MIRLCTRNKSLSTNCFAERKVESENAAILQIWVHYRVRASSRMTRIDPFRGLVSGIAGLKVSGLIGFIAVVLSVYIFEWMDQMPTDNVWFWFYGVVSIALSVSWGILIARLSYRGLTKIGDRKC